MRLQRHDGQVYLDRWGVEADTIGGIFLHRMDAPDPGTDLHDHPWSFLSIVVKGGYTEERALIRDAPRFAQIAEQFKGECCRGMERRRTPLSVARTRLDECHRITHLYNDRRCWTIVVHGPRRRRWGFYLPDGWMDESTYDDTVRVERRDLWNEPVGIGG